jgi:hypothetical protein
MRSGRPTVVGEMVFEKPIIDTNELLRALDPLGTGPAREFDRLRTARVVSTGMVAPGFRSPVRSDPVRLYCALNRDAIISARHGDSATASEFRRHAERIERETLVPWLQAAAEAPEVDLDVLSPKGEQELGDWIDDLLFGPPTDGEARVVEPAVIAARDIAEVRAQLSESEPRASLIVGRVWAIGDVFTDVRPIDTVLEDSFAVFSEEVLSAGLRLGDPVVVRHEELAPGLSLTTVERGLEDSRRVSRITGQPLPRHLDELLDAASLGSSRQFARPLRRLV